METIDSCFSSELFAMADDKGTIPYTMAEWVAIMHDLIHEFHEDYGTADRWVYEGEPLGVDVGELLVWLGY